MKDTDVLIRTRHIDGSLYIDALDLLNWVKTIKNNINAVEVPNPGAKHGAIVILDTFKDWLEKRV